MPAASRVQSSSSVLSFFSKKKKNELTCCNFVEVAVSEKFWQKIIIFLSQEAGFDKIVKSAVS